LWTATRPPPAQRSPSSSSPLLDHPAALDHLWSGGITRGAGECGLPRPSLPSASESCSVDVELSLAAQDELRAPRASTTGELRFSARSSSWTRTRPFFRGGGQRALGSPAERLGGRAPSWAATCRALAVPRFDRRLSRVSGGMGPKSGRLGGHLGQSRAGFVSAKYRRFPRWLESVAGNSLDPGTRADLALVSQYLPEAHRSRQPGPGPRWRRRSPRGRGAKWTSRRVMDRRSAPRGRHHQLTWSPRTGPRAS